ncbi:MAG: hypothetical protein IPI36_10390 [Chitinophagaceae bacterium]|nr:hypothetical protein [Chitinophagaceae bacterium]
MGCSFTVNNINVTNGTAPTGNATTNTTTCPGATDGSINVAPATPGTYTYVLTPGGATNTTGILRVYLPDLQPEHIRQQGLQVINKHYAPGLHITTVNNY